MRRAYGLTHIRQFRAEVLQLRGAIGALVGEPELTGSWIVWGRSGNGKTRFALQVAKELARHGRLVYNSLEEGMCLTMQRAIEEVGFTDVRKNFYLLDREPIEELEERLQGRHAPRFVVVDSLQYSGLDYDGYRRLVNLHRDKLFVWVSHADGMEPKGAVAQSVRFDANVKIRVESFQAMAQSRYGGGEPYSVWPSYTSRHGLRAMDDGLVPLRKDGEL